jgi:hypothetical protein
LIRTKKVTQILKILIRKREHKARRELDIDEVSQIVIEDKKIDEKSFGSFFRISTSHNEDIDELRRFGLSIPDPITTIYKYD